MLSRLPQLVLGCKDLAVEAARNARKLHDLGVAAGATIDAGIATRCIGSGLRRLHGSPGFDPFALHPGLRVVKPAA